MLQGITLWRLIMSVFLADILFLAMLKNIKSISVKKQVLSVIENITQANDIERRWVQSNPVILYECRLIEIAIIKFDCFIMRDNKLRKPCRL